MRFLKLPKKSCDSTNRASVGIEYVPPYGGAIRLWSVAEDRPPAAAAGTADPGPRLVVVQDATQRTRNNMVHVKAFLCTGNRLDIQSPTGWQVRPYVECYASAYPLVNGARRTLLGGGQQPTYPVGPISQQDWGQDIRGVAGRTGARGRGPTSGYPSPRAFQKARRLRDERAGTIQDLQERLGLF
jgi:hypothetical protein